ncbi:MAG: diaminopimelate epimerase [Armatimonadota bacterium]|nr:MAG: diaminopimelate epimerase [Armatimonadota bacterium]
MVVLPFSKMQGVGNDFVVVAEEAVRSFSLPELARQLCVRRFAIGADGLLVVGRGERHAVRMRMFNPDGSEDMCGNGLRCVAKWAVLHGLVNRTRFVVESIDGDKPVELLSDGRVRVELGEPHLEPEQVPVLAEVAPVMNLPVETPGGVVSVTSLSTGSTHSVVFVDSLPADERFLRDSPAIENHPSFPQRTSVLWAVVESPSRLRMRIWERGVGETLACGTGACAAAVAAQLHGMAGDSVEVYSPGGVLHVQWRPGSPVILTGAAELVYEGRYPCNEVDA